MSVQPCSNPTHPRGTLSAIVRQSVRAVYRFRTCDVCSRPQGIARIPKEATS